MFYNSPRFSRILTPEQANICLDLVTAHRAALLEKWHFGIWDGLRLSLREIDRAGGAYLRGPLSPLHYGGDIIEAAIIPTYTYIAWLGVKIVPGPFWDLAAMLPELTVEHDGETMVWRPVTIYRSNTPLVIVPLAAAVLPADNPLQGVSRQVSPPFDH